MCTPATQAHIADETMPPMEIVEPLTAVAAIVDDRPLDAAAALATVTDEGTTP